MNSIFKSRPNYWLLLDNVVINFLMCKSGLISEGTYFTLAERLSGQSKETGLVIYLAFLAKVANLYYIILTAFKKYWPDTVAKFISGTQETFI